MATKMATKMGQDTYGEPKVIHTDGATIRIFTPILTEEERERRMERIKYCAVELLRAQERVHRRMEKERGTS